MFISPAYAQAGVVTAAAVSSPFALSSSSSFSISAHRPQQNKAKQHREMLAAIRRGDKIVTNGGILGTVTKVVDENELLVEIAEGIRVRVQRGMVAGVRSKTEPVKDAPKAADAAASDKPESAASKLKNFLAERQYPPPVRLFEWFIPQVEGLVVVAVCAFGVLFALPNL
jgi:preprotein translocase subunit YajC